jgi:SSS family solute:Na+ symporter
MLVAPLLANTPQGIFGYLQKMNGLYFIPIFSVVLIGMLTKRVPGKAANIGLVTGFVVISLGYFVPSLAVYVNSMHEFHFLGVVFVGLLALMYGIGQAAPLATPYEQKDSGLVDLTPWKPAWPVGIALILVVLAVYIYFADMSVLGG